MSELVLLRLGPPGDLLEQIEAAAAAHHMAHARIHAGPGSLMHATLRIAAAEHHVAGPGVEILVLVGEIVDGRAHLRGAVGDPHGHVHAGAFIPGKNPICITVELALERVVATADSSIATGSPSAK